MRAFFLLLLSLFCFMEIFSPAFAASQEKYAVYYADALAADRFKPYQLVVFDATHHPALRPLKEEGKTLLGYISLGEVEMTSPSYAALKSRNLILMENKNWKGSYFVDMREAAWPKMVIEEIIPKILQQGFDGLFLDTLDNPLALEEQDPSRYHGMSDAAAHLVQAIRLHYPSIKIMMNRGYNLLPKVAGQIDMVMGESIYHDYDFARKAYGKVKDGEYREQVETLKQAQQFNPKLKVYTLDYADPKDTKTIVEIYRTERANGFIPFVSVIGLDRIIPEPEAE